MRNTLNKLKTVAQCHPSVNQVADGDVFAINGLANVNYPIVNIDSTAILVGASVATYNFRLYAFDRSNIDINDTLQIQSDMANILEDIIRDFGLIDDYIITPTVFTPFIEQFNDYCAGQYCDLTIQLLKLYDNCDTPNQLNNEPISISGSTYTDYSIVGVLEKNTEQDARLDALEAGSIDDHSLLINLDWIASEHSGTANKIAYFNSTGGTDYLDPNSDNITNNSNISGDTVTEAIDNLAGLINKLATPPIYTTPTSSITNVTNTYELGTTQTINITQTFNQNDGGSKISEVITKNSTTVSSGTTFSESLLIVTSTSYGGNVTYNTGPIKLNDLDIPDDRGRILSGTTTSSTRTISGIYPVYYLKSSTPITDVLMQSAINNGTANKLVINSTGTISIPYAPNSEYVAVAYPATSATKTKWYVTALSNGNIPGGVFGAQSTLNVNSFQGYWSNVPYKIHVTPLLSNPSATTIQLQN